MLSKLFLILLPLILWFFYLLIVTKSASKHRIIRLYFFGMLAVIPALVIENLFIKLFHLPSNLFSIFFLSFIIIALGEEVVKFFAFKELLELEETSFKEGIYYGVTVGLGFASGENVLYSLFYGGEVILARTLFTPLLHAALTGFVGYSTIKELKERGYILYRGLFWAVIIHGLYDFILLNSFRL